MDREQLIAQAKRLAVKARDESAVVGTYAEVCEFLRTYAGPKNSFLESAKDYAPTKWGEDETSRRLQEIMSSFVTYLEYLAGRRQTTVAHLLAEQLDDLAGEHLDELSAAIPDFSEAFEWPQGFDAAQPSS
jgi:hypothetical protein